MSDPSVHVDMLPPKYHQALVAWQEQNFKDYQFLLDHWSDFYRQDPFRLVAKMADLKNPLIEIGDHAGRPRFEKAAEMDEEAVRQAAAIIRAQASTELGSIQQHRESLHKAQDPRMQFDVLRVMAEEFRHAYQMLYVLAGDDWSRSGANIADQVVEDLLTMETGSHVLEAFNVYFDSFVDNVVFTALIDRVGKYQLTMQTYFAYAPMARSMPPMLSEEAFHLASGVNPLKRWVADAATDQGNVSLANIQRHVNKWFPLGLDMFGDERGGGKNIRLGFKNLSNQEAQDRYVEEVQEFLDTLNAIIIKTRMPDMAHKEAVDAAREMVSRGENRYGLSAADLLVLPARTFYRRRGAHAFAMCDVAGQPVSSHEDHRRHLLGVLPEAYVTSRDFSSYLEDLKRHQEGAKVESTKLPFYG